MVYGSYNFTGPSQLQANSLLIGNDPALCAYMWERYERSRAYGEANYVQEEVAGETPPAQKEPE